MITNKLPWQKGVYLGCTVQAKILATGETHKAKIVRCDNRYPYTTLFQFEDGAILTNEEVEIDPIEMFEPVFDDNPVAPTAQHDSNYADHLRRNYGE